MNHLNLSAILTALLAFILGVLALARAPRNKSAQIFACYSLSIALWSSCFAQLHRISDPSWAIWYGRLLHLGCTFIPAFFFHFAVSLSGEYERRKTLVIAAYALAATYNALNLFPGIFTAEIMHRVGYAYPRPIGLLYFSYFLFFAALVSYGLRMLWKLAPHLSGHHAKKLLLFLLATSFGYLGGLNNFLIMIDVQLFPLFPYGLYAVALYGVVGSILAGKSFFTVSARPGLSRLVERPGVGETTSVSSREAVHA